MVKRHLLSPMKGTQAVGMRQADSARYDVAGTLKIARNTVSKVLNKCRKAISVSDIPRL